MQPFIKLGNLMCHACQLTKISIRTFDVTYMSYTFVHENTLYVISSRISFLISKFLCDWYNLAINKATLHVNESCLICLIHKRIHLLFFFLPRSIHSFFSIYQRTELQTRIKSTVTYSSTMRQSLQ